MKAMIFITLKALEGLGVVLGGYYIPYITGSLVWRLRVYEWIGIKHPIPMHPWIIGMLLLSCILVFCYICIVVHMLLIDEVIPKNKEWADRIYRKLRRGRGCGV